MAAAATPCRSSDTEYKKILVCMLYDYAALCEGSHNQPEFRLVQVFKGYYIEDTELSIFVEIRTG